MDKAFNQLTKGMQDYNRVTNDGLMTKLTKFDEVMSNAISRLAGVTEEVNDNIADLTDAIKKMR